MKWFLRLIQSDGDPSRVILRIILGGVMFAHGAQKLFGWFGGHGFTGTMQHFTESMGIPSVLAFLAIMAESIGALALIAGLFTRVAALGIGVVMVVAIAMVHSDIGFFMNWSGEQSGEGFEYHLLVLSIVGVLLWRGGGKWAVDGWLESTFAPNQNPRRTAGSELGRTNKSEPAPNNYGYAMMERNEMTQKSSILAGSLLVVAVALPMWGCAPAQHEATPPNSKSASATSPGGSDSDNGSASDPFTNAVAELNPTEGSEVRGKVTFVSEIGGLRVIADVTGLTPGAHGFHIHENGDCSAPDGSSAGGHYNPAGVNHGGPDDQLHHTGDLGNLRADESGAAHLDFVFDFLKLNGPHSVVGRAVIVHQGEDDLSSQPSGAAGKRMACGIIRNMP